MKTLAVILLTLILIGFVIWVQVDLWNECRAMGFSRFYCWFSMVHR